MPVQVLQNWAMIKGEKEIDCFVEDTGHASSICWWVNRQWVFRSVFARGSEAVSAAKLKYEELEAAGWLPSDSNWPGSAESR